MAKALRKRRDITDIPEGSVNFSLKAESSFPSFDDPSSDVEIYAKEVLGALLRDNLPPTPNNFTLYFDRLLENKTESLKKQIKSIMELEESTGDETTVELENTLKKGFVSVKNILTVSAGLYKNMSLMSKILEKRKDELSQNKETANVLHIVDTLGADLSRLDDILKKQIDTLKELYDQTAAVIKDVENETIFDNRYGLYNKRYLLNKITQEIQLIKEFKHTSTLITIELSKDLANGSNSEKAVMLMTRTIARLLLKTSRRSDIVAHYGSGVFAMLLKHTDIDSSIKAAQRLSELVHSTNFFLAEKEIDLSVSIGITPININSTTDDIIINALKAMQKANSEPNTNYVLISNEPIE